MRNSLSAVLISMMVVAALPAMAGPIDFDKWYNFRTEDGVDLGDGVGFAVGHSSAEPDYFAPGDPAWTFTATGFGAYLTILDGGEHGDIYNAWDNNVLIGTTSIITPEIGVGCGAFPEPCLTAVTPGSQGWSVGTFYLAPGDHSIRISIFDTPYVNSNLSWFRVTAADAPPVTEIPEPGTFALLGAGLLFMGAFRRRRQAGKSK